MWPPVALALAVASPHIRPPAPCWWHLMTITGDLFKLVHLRTYPLPHWFWHLVAEVRTVDKRAVRILLEYLLVWPIFKPTQPPYFKPCSGQASALTLVLTLLNLSGTHFQVSTLASPLTLGVDGIGINLISFLMAIFALTLTFGELTHSFPCLRLGMLVTCCGCS